MSSYQDRKSHCGDKTVVRSSYLHNAISYTGEISSFYWIGDLTALSKMIFECISPDYHIIHFILTHPNISVEPVSSKSSGGVTLRDSHLIKTSSAWPSTYGKYVSFTSNAGSWEQTHNQSKYSGSYSTVAWGYFCWQRLTEIMAWMNNCNHVFCGI